MPKLTGAALRIWREVASRGGKNRAKKHSKEQLREWAKLGGRPKGSVKTDRKISKILKAKKPTTKTQRTLHRRAMDLVSKK